MSQLDDITTKVTKLEGKVNSIETMSGKLDTTIEKLTDVSTSIKTMLAVHEEKINRGGEVDDELFSQIKKRWANLDFVVHAIGFSDKSELRGRYVETSRDNFLNTMDISVYSFTAVTKRASELMQNGGSILTLTYYGAEQVMPHYNVMGIAKAALEASVMYLAEDLGKDGIRVNAISAGPIKTLAASGIGDFRYILKWNELNSPLRRNVTIEDVGKSGLYLLSDLGSGVTGETVHVDAGYHVVGMKAVDAPDIDVVTGKTEK